MEDYFSMTPEKLLKRRNLTDLWRRRQISNFDYLMELNTIAGKGQGREGKEEGAGEEIGKENG
jgi:hypothetical protein